MWETAYYADDTTPCTAGKTISDVISSLETCSKIQFGISQQKKSMEKIPFWSQTLTGGISNSKLELNKNKS